MGVASAGGCCEFFPCLCSSALFSCVAECWCGRSGCEKSFVVCMLVSVFTRSGAAFFGSEVEDCFLACKGGQAAAPRGRGCAAARALCGRQWCPAQRSSGEGTCWFGAPVWRCSCLFHLCHDCYGAGVTSSECSRSVLGRCGGQIWTFVAAI